MHISKQYPDMFDYVGLFSAAIMPNKDVKSPIYDNLEVKLKTQFAKKPALYYIAIGNKDFLFQAITTTARCWTRRVTNMNIMKPEKVISGRTGVFT